MKLNNIIKPLLLIFVIIILASVIIRVSSRGETLFEYAANNPELTTLTTPELTTPELTTPASTQQQEVTEKSSEKQLANTQIDSDTYSQPIGPPLQSSTQLNDQESENLEMNVKSDRIVYQTGFHSDPLSEDIIKRITGISYPVRESQKESLSFTPVNVVADDTKLAVDYTDLRHLTILYYNFKGIESTGELICNKAIAQDLLEIFYELYKNEYQIEQIRLIDEYSGDDKLSMMDNNTSCFNYRVVEGTSNLSKHAYGLAVDINPFFNPYIEYNKDGSLYVSPPGSESYVDRSAPFSYKIDENDLCYRLFKEHGFIWGGNWNSMKDYQHFQKAID